MSRSDRERPSRPRPHLALRARHGDSEIAFVAREHSAIVGVVVLLVVVAVVVTLRLA